ncbi:MAG: reductive dehalogenase [Planctomycetes bacterium]|nr:reductive dehalogenase [Planctomycetota bacterium]
MLSPSDLRRFLDAPFLVDDSRYRRFPQRDIGFARARWDASFPGFGKEISEDAPARVRQGLPGYSRLGYALQAASWTVYDTYPGGFSRERIGGLPAGTGPVARTEDPLTAALGRFEGGDPARTAAAVKRAARALGAADAGIAAVNPRWLYASRISGEALELPPGMDRAVVMLVAMDLESLRASPAVAAGVATGTGYSRMAFLTACLSEFIRNLGWRAIASGNDTALSVPLAVDAGLGEFGRNGLLIHPRFGQRVRICKVFTDLPLAPGRPAAFGAKRFCMTCMKCAQQCPSRAISFDREPSWGAAGASRSNNPGALKWYVDPEACYGFWTRNTVECSNCIRACPYTKDQGWIHAVPRFFIRRLPLANRLWAWADTLFGYGKCEDRGEYP